jgi:dTDP-L-rhamnose 4-epimerase
LPVKEFPLTADRILVTGGAGFIGSRLVRHLRASAEKIVVFDNLHPQVHGERATFPDEGGNLICIRADVRDGDALRSAISDHTPTLIYHLAAETGTGQSYDLISRYCDVNVGGTARLLEALRQSTVPARRVVLAGSRAVYGEGACRAEDGSLVIPAPRLEERLKAGDFVPRDLDGRALTPVPTPEQLSPSPASIYGSTKLMQEYLLEQSLAGTATEPVLLRFQNVYGPGQSLRNPYTGVLSIFCSQILEGKTLNIFEDGEIVRDFIFVDDVVEALARAGAVAAPGSAPINIGSGTPASILGAAQFLLKVLGAPEDRLVISGDFRIGDIRYSVADIRRARELLDWQPRFSLEKGLTALAEWARQEAALQR